METESDSNGLSLYDQNILKLKNRVKGHRMEYDVFKSLENHVACDKDHFN